jgi:hypothetical protein
MAIVKSQWDLSLDIYSRKLFAKMARIHRKAASRLHSEIVTRAKQHTTDMRYEAHSSGWPAHLVAALNVRVTPEGHYKVQYPKDLEHEILTLEYGTEDVPPSPVMRNYFTKVGN